MTAWSTAAALGLALASVAGCEEERTTALEPERESARVEGAGEPDTVALRDEVGVREDEPTVPDELRPPERSGTDPQAGELDNVEQGHRLRLEDEQVQVTVPEQDEAPAPAGSAGQPSAGQPSAGQPSAGQPPAGELSARRPSARRPSARQPAAGQGAGGTTAQPASPS